jgi:two-component system chemotaxis response regulator CheB
MSKRDIVAIGGSAGAIDAAKQLLARLPADFPGAILLVIHVGAHGKDLLATILGAGTPLHVSTAVEGEVVTAGRVYVAPADHHLLIVDGVVRLGRGPRENLTRPAIDPLFRSVAACYGPRAVGVVLTGHLNDGAAGLAVIARCGGATAIQNPSDAVAAEMPLSALEAVDVDYRASATDLAEVLTTLVTQEVDPDFLPSKDLTMEVGIALGRSVGTTSTARIADPVALSCPACGGVLSQLRDGPPLRFRCQVGHAYTAKILAHEKEGAVDEALRVALRVLEERVVLLEKMAREATDAGRILSGEEYARRAVELRERAEILRLVALEGDGERPVSQVAQQEDS